MIALVPLIEADRDVFIREEVANYAEDQIRDAGWPRSESFERGTRGARPSPRARAGRAGVARLVGPQRGGSDGRLALGQAGREPA
jgi:hypothetical protein